MDTIVFIIIPSTISEMCHFRISHTYVDKYFLLFYIHVINRFYGVPQVWERLVRQQTTMPKSLNPFIIDFTEIGRFANYSYGYLACKILEFIKFSSRVRSCLILYLLVKTAVRVRYCLMADSCISGPNVDMMLSSFFWYFDNLLFSSSCL